ncbi:nucleotide sugar dehydrogenase [Campylobacter geochelonis]|uniref:nucleotide sugar dehydrogenase n=1 Tax=Campylobacter geochelonis TaxID=1780362 RepID=UPI0007708A49|nr:nucleotide sugar dehydrogenase [Campylobacter geochelonis]CZE49276.1 nucleotide sugar dehydrogenase subfamily protein [Campylobacter geochelonis]CZE51401.1 nucleotide sugar dehydrogenase subfamily protein [Campylobacter geochelonis]
MNITLIGLGYVGLPLAAAFATKHKVVGFDISKERVEELNTGHDRTLELDDEKLRIALKNGIKFTNKIDDIKDSNFYIICVPTPVDDHNKPDLTPLIKASQTVGKVLKKGDIVIYESTVYPGATEEDCVPVLEEYSRLKFNKDFFCGYSPERINPGDKEHTVTKIRKIVSGSTQETLDKVDELYSSIITAGTFRAASIKVAEAAKVIENTQRDINIGFVNELSVLFNKLDINTNDVIDAAATKWNFLSFRPGLVGGHCIGVDPYYLAHKAVEVGYHPEIILASRRLNDHMGFYVATQIVKMMIKFDKKVKSSKVLVLGLTFKENCTDTRNTRVVDIISELEKFGINVDIYDPWVDKNDAKKYHNIDLVEKANLQDYDCVVIAVAHKEFFELDYSKSLVFDVKNVYKNAEGRL